MLPATTKRNIDTATSICVRVNPRPDGWRPPIPAAVLVVRMRMDYGLRNVVTELVNGPRLMKDQELSTRIIFRGGFTERLVMVVRLVT